MKSTLFVAYSLLLIFAGVLYGLTFHDQVENVIRGELTPIAGAASPGFSSLEDEQDLPPEATEFDEFDELGPAPKPIVATVPAAPSYWKACPPKPDLAQELLAMDEDTLRQKLSKLSAGHRGALKFKIRPCKW